MTQDIQLPQSLIDRIQYNPQEDIIALCVTDIIETQLAQLDTTQATRSKLSSRDFHAKLASQIFAKSLQKTFLEHPEFTPADWVRTTADNADTSDKIVQAITQLRQENQDFARQFTLNIFDSYLLVRSTIES